MMHVKLLVSPLAKGAYFAEYIDVSMAEVCALVEGVTPQLEQVGQLDFLALEVDEAALPTLARASCVHGIFGVEGAHLVPLDVAPDFLLHEDLVYGAKYKGKTNELVTQLAINLALRYSTGTKSPKTLLDPMAGKGTTLLWALRYGLNARGIDTDRNALDALHRHVKKQTKLHRIKHRRSEGFVGKKKRDGEGKFVHFDMAERHLRLISGDSRNARRLLANQRFDMIVGDLPYGVQFRGDKKQRSPLETIRECAEVWDDCLRIGGAIVLIFNTYQPGRDELVEVFASLGFHNEAFTAPHRMSESIVRDLVVFTRPS